MTSMLGLVLLVLIVIGGVALVRRFTAGRARGATGDADLIPYALLALAVIAGGFALARLGQAAFPGDTFVFDARQQVATSLATLVVAVPLAAYLWQRQARRRLVRPISPGWTLYLTLINAVFVTSLVVAAFRLLEFLFGEGSAPTWTDVIVFGGIVVVHELAARSTPPRSDAADLPRIVGTAAGLVPLVIGLGGLLYWVLDRLYSSFAAAAGGPSVVTSLALALVGAATWAYYWLRPWPEEPGAPRNAWMFITAVIGLSSAIAAFVSVLVSTLLFMFTESDPAGAHFEDLPVQLTVLAVGALLWWHHRARLGPERTDPVRAYEYAMAAVGLAAAIGSATALSAAAFGSEVLVGASADDIIGLAVALLASVGVWWWFWSRATRQPREIEAVSAPRRVYLLGMGIVTGLVSAGALIATLYVLFQRLLGVPERGGSLVVQVSLFLFAGATAWHLLQTYFHDRSLVEDEAVITPYEVTLICSHPGMIATLFPKQARLKVLYRDDQSAPIDEETAAAIVEAVRHRSSLVWVDEEGFRVAPARE